MYYQALDAAPPYVDFGLDRVFRTTDFERVRDCGGEAGGSHRCPAEHDLPLSAVVIGGPRARHLRHRLRPSVVAPVPCNRSSKVA